MAEVHTAQRPDPSGRPAKYGAVFSYSNRNAGQVEGIYDELKRRGVCPWIDLRDQRRGNDWRESYTAAIRDSSAAIIVFGPEGLGQWQEEEIQFIQDWGVRQKSEHHSDFPVIHVLLPGGVLPDGVLGVRARSPIVFRENSANLIAYDQLEFALTGINPADASGRYAIHLEVPTIGRTCFLAVSHASDSRVFELMVHAAQATGIVVEQAREFTGDAKNIYAPEVVMAIRSASLVIADGTRCISTGKPDADVMYEVGLAQALAKPIVFLTNPIVNVLPLEIFERNSNCTFVEFVPSDLEVGLAQLKERLCNHIRTTLNSGRPPHLVSNNGRGIGVSYSDVFRLRAVFWSHFERILKYGLATKRSFAAILKQVHKLQQIVDLALGDVTNVRGGIDPQLALQRFRERYEHFCKPHVQVFELALLDDSAKAEAAESLRALLTETTGEIRRIVERTKKFFENLDSFLSAYHESHDAVLRRLEHPETVPQSQVIQLHSDVHRLAQDAEFVEVHACEMMFELLELVGMRNEPGADNGQ